VTLDFVSRHFKDEDMKNHLDLSISKNFISDSSNLVTSIILTVKLSFLLAF